MSFIIGFICTWRICLSISKAYLKVPTFPGKGPVLHLLGGRGYLKDPMLHLLGGGGYLRGGMRHLLGGFYVSKYKKKVELTEPNLLYFSK